MMEIMTFQMIDIIHELNNETGVICSESQIPEHSYLFEQHFPDFPVLPGTYTVEAIAQTCGFFVFKHQGLSTLPFLAGVDKVRFSTFVKPRDSLIVKALLKRNKRNLFLFNAEVLKQGEVVAQASVKMSTMPFPTPELRRQLLQKGRNLTHQHPHMFEDVTLTPEYEEVQI